MSHIERWWRVTAAGGTVGTWTDQDPSDRLIGAWTGATVEGPFVPEAQLQGPANPRRDPPWGPGYIGVDTRRVRG